MLKGKVAIAATVSAFALGAVVAPTQSLATSGWFINNEALAGTAALATTANVMENPKLSFSSVTVECTGASLESTGPLIESPETGLASSLKFTGCTATGGGCSLKGTTVSTVALTALASTVGTSEALAILKPKTKTTFATMGFTGETCALPEADAVTGTALVKAPTGQSEHASQEIVANTPSGELKVASNAATLKGKALLKLASGESWSLQEYLAEAELSDTKQQLNLRGNVDFGSVPSFGVTTRPFRFTSTPNQNDWFLAASITNLTGTAFSIETDGCNKLLAANNSCTVTVKFNPQAAGNYLADLTVRVDQDINGAPGGRSVTFIWTLTGKGT